MKIIGYARVSTEEQKKSGFGIQRQIEQITSYAKQLDTKVYEMFIDEGRSGKLPINKRPGLLHALLALHEKDTVLIVESRDRLARSTIVAEEIDEMIKKYGSRVICTDENTDNYKNLKRKVLHALLDNEELLK